MKRALRPIVKRVGRPRDRSVDDSIVKAALALMEEEGVHAPSMEAIAARAGVGKTTIYRRWGSKEELMVDAVAHLVGQVEMPEEGEIRDRLITVLSRVRQFMSHAKAGTIFPWFAGELSSGSDIGCRYAEAVILPRRRMMATMIEEAIANGELRADLDVEVAVDMLTGPVVMRKLMGSLLEDREGWEEKLVDSLLQGWVAR